DDFQPRLVQRQDVLDDRQPQSRAAGGARAAGGNAVEAFGQARDVLRRDAVAGVGNAEARAAAGLAFPSDSDAAAIGRVTHRVADQVGERAVQVARRTAQVATGPVL